MVIFIKTIEKDSANNAKYPYNKYLFTFSCKTYQRA